MQSNFLSKMNETLYKQANNEVRLWVMETACLNTLQQLFFFVNNVLTHKKRTHFLSIHSEIISSYISNENNNLSLPKSNLWCFPVTEFAPLTFSPLTHSFSPYAYITHIFTIHFDLLKTIISIIIIIIVSLHHADTHSHARCIECVWPRSAFHSSLSHLVSEQLTSGPAGMETNPFDLLA